MAFTSPYRGRRDRRNVTGPEGGTVGPPRPNPKTLPPPKMASPARNRPPLLQQAPANTAVRGRPVDKDGTLPKVRGYRTRARRGERTISIGGLTL